MRSHDLQPQRHFSKNGHRKLSFRENEDAERRVTAIIWNRPSHSTVDPLNPELSEIYPKPRQNKSPNTTHKRGRPVMSHKCEINSRKSSMKPTLVIRKEHRMLKCLRMRNMDSHALELQKWGQHIVKWESRDWSPSPDWTRVFSMKTRLFYKTNMEGGCESKQPQVQRHTPSVFSGAQPQESIIFSWFLMPLELFWLP